MELWDIQSLRQTAMDRWDVHKDKDKPLWSYDIYKEVDLQTNHYEAMIKNTGHGNMDLVMYILRKDSEYIYIYDASTDCIPHFTGS